MNRREFLKSVSALTAVAILPIPEAVAEAFSPEDTVLYKMELGYFEGFKVFVKDDLGESLRGRTKFASVIDDAAWFKMRPDGSFLGVISQVPTIEDFTGRSIILQEKKW